MELHQIRYAVALAATRNFTRAASQCNVGQPALTRAIQLLEGELGGALFHRGRAMTTPTELGEAVLPYFRQVEHAISQARADATALISLRAGRLRMGVTDCVDPDLVAPILADFAQNHPDVAIVVRTFDRPALVEALMRGEVSLGLECSTDEPDDRFAAHAIHEEPLVIAGLNGGSAAERLLMMGSEPAGAGLMVDRERWAEAAAASGVGAALLPASAAERRGLSIRGAREDKRTTRLLTVRGRQHPPAVASFLRMAARRRRVVEAR